MWECGNASRSLNHVGVASVVRENDALTLVAPLRRPLEVGAQDEGCHEGHRAGESMWVALPSPGFSLGDMGSTGEGHGGF